MNISPDGKTVRFKTEPAALFLAEKSGAKPNTVRIIDAHEYEQLQIHEPEKIIAQHQQEIILRTITHVYVSDMVLGKYIAIFSWNPNEKHPHSSPDEQVSDPEAHIILPDLPTEPSSDDAFVAVTISRNLFHSLQLIAHGRSMNMVIRELYEASCYQHHVDSMRSKKQKGGRVDGF